MADKAAKADEIRGFIAERLERKVEEVVDSAKFIDDLGADSLDITELMMALEEEYGIEIADDSNQIETVGDAIAYIEAKLKG
jgi:acyl carrier protein